MGASRRSTRSKVTEIRSYRSNFVNVVLAITIVLLAAYSLLWVASSTFKFETPGFSLAVRRNLTKVTRDIKIVIILCDDEDRKVNRVNPSATTFERQVNQTLVLIKSLVITLGDERDMLLDVTLISDKKENFEKVSNYIFKNRKTSWDPRFTRYLKLTFVPLQYPQGTSWMRSLFRPCATLRLFLPDLLPYDAVLYLDTDIVFFRSVVDLWSIFGSFEVTTVAAMAPCLFHYGTSRNTVPYYGSSGLNAGMMLMNLTRMRNDAWTRKIRRISTQYRARIKLADQDILNIYFSGSPNQIQVIGCDWNFRPFQCQAGSSSCQVAETDGISALHGNALSFSSNGPEPLFYSIFLTLSETRLDLTFDLSELITSFHHNLNKVNGSSRCASLTTFKSFALKRLENDSKKLSLA